MRAIFFILLLFFSGCTIKKALNKDPIYEKTLKYTKRCQILSSLETKALIDIVYLNPLYQEKFKNQTFLIGVYNDFNNTLENIEFNLTINNQIPKISNKIPQFILYKNFPFYNSWMNYYLVEINTSKPLNIEYKSRHWSECRLFF